MGSSRKWICCEEPGRCAPFTNAQPVSRRRHCKRWAPLFTNDSRDLCQDQARSRGLGQCLIGPLQTPENLSALAWILQSLKDIEAIIIGWFKAKISSCLLTEVFRLLLPNGATSSRLQTPPDWHLRVASRASRKRLPDPILTVCKWQPDVRVGCS